MDAPQRSHGVWLGGGSASMLLQRRKRAGRRYGRPSFTPSLRGRRRRGGHGTELLQHPERVEEPMALDDLAAGDAIELHAGDGYVLAGGSDSHQLRRMRTPGRPVRGDPVTLRDDAVDLQL